MSKEKFLEDLSLINEYTKNINSGLKDLFEGVKGTNKEYREVLEEYLEFIGIEKNEETRLCAYFRMINSNENSLILYMEKNNFPIEKQEEILDISLSYIGDFYKEIQDDFIDFVENKKLLTLFYREVLKGTHRVGILFNEFFPLWRKHIVYGVNKELEEKFNNDAEKIMQFLKENNLLDLGHNGEIADRTYSVLVKNKKGDYESKSYREAFEEEINNIIQFLNNFAGNLENLEDEIFNSKNEYIKYLNALIDALKETNVNKLVEKWTEVDEEWMQIKTPIQIVHPCEYYEDKYRKAVSPDWDLRIKNEVFESKVDKDILYMYENLYDELGRDKYKDSYKFSLNNQKRVQLYLSNQVLYYAAFFVSKYSAQVIPNDEVASKKFGKKIYALPEDILGDKRKRPFMKLTSMIFEESLLDEYRKYIFGDDSVFYNVYDTETIGHEYGHTLWLTPDTEIIMNSKTGVFKNIEEFKATIGGLNAYFVKDYEDLELSKKLIIDHIFRSIGLLAYKKINDIEPYYCESLIHLFILFSSGIILISDDKKIEINWSKENYGKLKELYLIHYKKLIQTYLDKKDAGEFLFQYMVKENGYYLPKDKKIRDFVNYYYEMYEKYGNEIDSSIDKSRYIN